MSDIFGHVLTWLVQFVLFVPFQLIRLVGLLFPSCSTLGIVSLSQTVVDNMVQMIRFLWPVIKYVPWTFCFNLLSALLLYWFFKWVWNHWHKLASLGFTFWIAFTIFYGIGYLIDFFLDDGWADSPVFSEVFGESPSSTSGWSGGGFGGGGGGGW